SQDSTRRLNLKQSRYIVLIPTELGMSTRFMRLRMSFSQNRYPPRITRRAKRRRLRRLCPGQALFRDMRQVCTRGDEPRSSVRPPHVISVTDHANDREDADEDDQQRRQRALLETAAGGELVDVGRQRLDVERA